jgi:hypothetical protein
MIEIALVACLLKQPERCQDVRLVFSDESVSVVQCSMGRGGAEHIAEWMSKHHGYFAKRWQCRPAGLWAKA